MRQWVGPACLRDTMRSVSGPATGAVNSGKGFRSHVLFNAFGHISYSGFNPEIQCARQCDRLSDKSMYHKYSGRSRADEHGIISPLSMSEFVRDREAVCCATLGPVRTERDAASNATTVGTQSGRVPEMAALKDVELRELRVFLALAEELHFGRTQGGWASPSRWSAKPFGRWNGGLECDYLNGAVGTSS